MKNPLHVAIVDTALATHALDHVCEEWTNEASTTVTELSKATANEIESAVMTAEEIVRRATVVIEKLRAAKAVLYPEKKP